MLYWSQPNPTFSLLAKPPRIQPTTFILTLKTHKLTVLTTVTQPEKTTIGDLKVEALNALQADVLSTDRDGDVDMMSEWAIPPVDSVEDFELCRAIRERGRPTGQYETLSTKDVVKQVLVNWESLFMQFKNANGEWHVLRHPRYTFIARTLQYIHVPFVPQTIFSVATIAASNSQTRHRQVVACQGLSTSPGRRR